MCHADSTALGGGEGVWVTTAQEWLKERPAYMEEWRKCLFAYHAGHFQQTPGSHNFTSGDRQSVCLWCGRTRELVRWDDSTPECASRPEIHDTASVIHGEEARYFALLERAKLEVPAIVARMGMAGSTLAFLHGTHGYDPETVAGVVEVPAGVIREYEEAREVDRELSRRATVRELVCARTA